MNTAFIQDCADVEVTARQRAAGQVLGRPRGRLNSRIKLTGRETEIARLLADGCSRNKIARLMRVHPATVKSFIQKSPELKVYADA